MSFFKDNKNSILGSIAGLGLGPVGSLLGGAVGGTVDETNAEQQKLSDYQTNLALRQEKEADALKRQLDEQGRPIMEAQVNRQQEIADLAQRYAREGMPTAQREYAQQNIQQQQSQALAGASSLGGGIRTIGNVTASTADMYRNLNAQDSTIAQQNQGQYLNALNMLGAAEGQAEQYNMLDPYAQALANMQALQGASIQNQMGALGFNYQAAAQNQQQAMDLTGAGISAGGNIAGSLIGSMA